MKKIGFLSNNALKIIACISMFIDHLGFMIFPTNITLRIIGRIAFPIFAYMLAEGAIYTKNKVKHLGILALLAIVIQVFMYFFANFKDFSIFIHFSLSLILIYLLDYSVNRFKDKKYLMGIIGSLCFVLLTGFLYYLTVQYPYFYMNYGFFGIIIPVVIYAIKKYIKHYTDILSLLALAVLVIIFSFYVEITQNLYALMGVFLLIFYNGKRGKLKLKYFFYLFYPLHFVVLFGIQLLMNYLK